MNRSETTPPRRRTSPGRTTLRDLLVKLHRWIGLGVAVFFFIAAGTGAVLVYEEELDTLLNGGRLPVTPGDVGVEAVDAALAREAPDAQISWAFWPTPRQPVYRVVLREERGSRAVLVDPGSGRVISPTRPFNRVLAGLRALHVNLLAGPVGARLVSLATLLAVVSMLMGAVVWWPGLRRLARGFRIRTRRTFYILNFDLHQVLGILALPLLLVLSVTGVALGFPQLGDALAHGLLLQRPAEAPELLPVRSTPPPEGAPAELAPLATLADAALEAVPGTHPIRLLVEPDPTAPSRLWLETEEPMLGEAVVLLDRYSGRVLQVRDPRGWSPPYQLSRGGFERLHIGAIGGQPFRIAYVLASLVGALLVPTGVVVWWLKRKRLGESAQQRSQDRGESVDLGVGS